MHEDGADMTKKMWIGVAIAGFLVLVAAVMLSRPRGTNDPATVSTLSSGSVIPALPGYAESAQQSCLQNAGASSAAITAYCSCFATKSGELITAADAAYIAANKTLPADFKAKVAPVMSSCAAENGVTIRQ
jgi:hypothetical protein